MRANTFFLASLCLFCWLGHSFLPAQDQSVDRQLQQVNDLLDQVRAATGSNIPKIPSKADQKQIVKNPFSLNQNRVNDGPGVQSSAPGPQVQIGPNDIQIDLNGKSFSIPRATGQPASKSASSVLPSKQTGLGSAIAYVGFSQSLVEFEKGNYQKAEALAAEASQKLAGDNKLRQFYAMMLFQNQKFEKAAELAYEALRTEQPFDWSAIRSMYRGTDDYATAYQALQQKVTANSGRTALRFLLGYHHLMIGHQKHAASEFTAVGEKLRGDSIVAKMQQLASVQKSTPPSPRD